MDYEKIYNQIIEISKTRILSEDIYVEKHHIIPKCMGGDDNLSNIAILTPEEHFVCHQLLVKIYPSNYSLIKAVRMMCVTVDGGQGKHIRNNKEYKWIKEKRYKRIKCVCKECGSIFYRMPCKISDFCSKECKGEFKKIEITCKGCGIKFKKFKSFATVFCNETCKREYTNRITTTCRFCKKEFSKHPHEKKTTCSIECFHQHYFYKKQLQKSCIHCQKQFIVSNSNKNKKFCSNSCRHNFDALQKEQKKITKDCKCCGKSFTTSPTSRPRKFCSKRCGYESMWDTRKNPTSHIDSSNL